MDSKCCLRNLRKKTLEFSWWRYYKIGSEQKKFGIFLKVHKSSGKTPVLYSSVSLHSLAASTSIPIRYGEKIQTTLKTSPNDRHFKWFGLNILAPNSYQFLPTNQFWVIFTNFIGHVYSYRLSSPIQSFEE